VERTFDAIADDLAAVSDVGAEVATVPGHHVQFARLVAVGDEVFTEIPKGPHLADRELR
jgi:hypothetical protein